MGVAPESAARDCAIGRQILICQLLGIDIGGYRDRVGVLVVDDGKY